MITENNFNKNKNITKTIHLSGHDDDYGGILMNFENALFRSLQSSHL